MRLFTILFFAAMSVTSFAQVEGQINFRGQNSEVMKIDQSVNVVRSEAYQEPDTCYRDVPYEAHECRDVTRHRNECRYVPASEDCRTEYDRVCRNVTRTREECTNGPDRQVCRDNPDRQVCRDNPDRQVCTDNPSRQVCTDNPSRQVCTQRPSREVCVERPTREVCRTDSSGQQRCTTVGGGQSCQTVGGGESCETVGGGQSCQTVGGGETCRTVDGGQTCSTVPGGQTCGSVPGERICRDVSYTDQDCDDVPRQACTTIPGRDVCEDIPYQEEVCGNVTRYRKEPYACERTAYRDVTTKKKLTGEIQLHFETNGLVEEFPLQVSVTAPDAKFETFAISTKLMKQPKVLVFLKKKEVKAQETKEEIKLQGDLVYEIVNAEMVSPVFPKELKAASLNMDTGLLSLTIDGAISSQGAVEAVVIKKRKFGKVKTVAELKASYPSDRAGVAADKLNLNLAGLIKQKLAKKNEVKLKLSAEMSVRGELLNAEKPEMHKSYTIELKK